MLLKVIGKILVNVKIFLNAEKITKNVKKRKNAKKRFLKHLWLKRVHDEHPSI